MFSNVYVDSMQIHNTGSIGLTTMTLSAPAPRTVSDNNPMDHGATDWTMFYGPRTIELTGIIQAPDFPTMWAQVDALKQNLALGSYHTLKFRRSGLSYDETAVVRVDSPLDIPVDNSPAPFIKWGVSLFAADPRIYSATLNSASYDPTSAVGASNLKFSLTFPLMFLAGSASAGLSLQNQGTIATPPTITINGPGTNPVVTNYTTSQSIYTTACALNTGDQLVINCGTRSVLLNGASRPDLIDSSQTTFFSLNPGFNTIQMSGTNFTTGVSSLSASWQDARI